METLNNTLSNIADFVWGTPLILLLLGTGVYLTLRLVLVQIRAFKHGVDITFGKYDDPSGKAEGQLNHFQALAAALSATVGIGNIAGVATAIYYGGPGAIFWMWVSAFFGMAIKYASCSLAVKYREIDPDGEIRGGPMYFIKNGFAERGPLAKKAAGTLAFSFALLTAIAAFGAGNMVQSNTLSHQIVDFFGASEDILWLWRLLIGLSISGLVGVVIIGGVKRIGNVASFLVPVMSVLYVGSALVILFMNSSAVPDAFAMIFEYAFNPTAATGGFAGATVWATMTWGLKRGLFSNEAGLGSSPMLHATAKEKYPPREGFVAMMEPFIDTIIICTMTALVIIVSGVWDSGVNGAPLTSNAFEALLPNYGAWMVTIGILLFAFSTVLSWSYYGEKGTEYMFGASAKPTYRIVFVLFTFIGANLDLQAVWSFADIANALQAIPNLIGLIVLSGVVAKYTSNYFTDKKNGLHQPTR